MELNLKRFYIIVCALLMSVFTQAQPSVKTKDVPADSQNEKEHNQQMLEIWKFFSKAVLSNDLQKIKRLSAECIRVDVHSFISIDSFLINYFSHIFDSITRSNLNIKESIVILNAQHNARLYDDICIRNSSQISKARYQEVLISVKDNSYDNAGQQKAFEFIQSESGYKFCGYSTIP